MGEELKLTEEERKKFAEKYGHNPDDLSDEELQKCKVDLRIAGARKVRWTARELYDTYFPPLRWYIPGLLTTGLTLLWGSPKFGKSILALQWALSIASGGYVFGKLQCEKAGVVYLSLEDGPRRLQRRIKSLGIEPPDGVEFFTEWTRENAIDNLSKYLEAAPHIEIVFIDTLIRYKSIGDTNDYSQTSDLLIRLKEIADRREIAIVVIHHSKKLGKDESGDFIDSALGSRGLTGQPDHLTYLTKGKDGIDAVLHFKSKDAEPKELALKYDATIDNWALMGDVQEIQTSAARQEIYDLLAGAENVMTPKEIAKELDKNQNTVRVLLKRMVDDDVLAIVGRGNYTLKYHPTPVKPVNNVNNVNNQQHDKQETFTTFTKFTGSEGEGISEGGNNADSKRTEGERREDDNNHDLEIF